MPDNDFQDIHDALGIQPTDPEGMWGNSQAAQAAGPVAAAIASGVGSQALNMLTGPGRAYSGQMSPEEQYKWGPEMALNMLGGGAPSGSAGIGLAKLATGEKAATITMKDLFPKTMPAVNKTPKEFVANLGGETKFAKTYPLTYKDLKPYLSATEDDPTSLPVMKQVFENAWKSGNAPTSAVVDHLTEQGIVNPYKHIAQNDPTGQLDDLGKQLETSHGDWSAIGQNKSSGLPTVPPGYSIKKSASGNDYWLQGPIGEHLGYGTPPELADTAYTHHDLNAPLDDDAIDKALAKNPGASLADIAGHSELAPKAAPYNPSAQNVDFSEHLKPIDDWQEQRATKDNGPAEFDDIGMREQARGQGYNVDMPLWKGGHWTNYGDALPNPKDKNWEKGIFFGDHPAVASDYTKAGAEPLQYIARAHQPMEIDWPSATGMTHYNGTQMDAMIKSAHDQGADMLVVRNINDMGTKQDQYVVLDPSIVRQPGAAFDPSKMHLNKLAAGLAGGGVVGAAMASDQNEEK